jgi:hypothetical protein
MRVLLPFVAGAWFILAFLALDRAHRYSAVDGLFPLATAILAVCVLAFIIGRKTTHDGDNSPARSGPGPGPERSRPAAHDPGRQ